MPAEFYVCNENELLWDEYFVALLRHYEELSLPYDFEMSFSFLGNPILQGNAVVAIEQGSGLAVAALGFVFGTGTDGYENTEVCQVEAVFLDRAYRRTVMFHSLLHLFTETLVTQYPETSKIQFWSPADRSDLRSLFAKFSDRIKTNEKSFGRIDLFQTTTASLQAYCARRSKGRKGRGLKNEI